MAPPLLVVEVVSPGELQHDRDYIAKRSQYQDIGIPKYWIVDPQEKTVTVLGLVDAVYTEVGTFQEADLIRSPQFPELQVTSTQILG